MKILHRKQYSALGRLTLITLIISYSNNAAWGETATEEAALKISPNTFIDPENISGIALSGDLLILGSDEGAAIQVLTKSATNSYLSDDKQRIILDNSGEEVDIEGIAAGEKFIYVVGSHSSKRKKVKEKKSFKENHKRLATTKFEPSREQLFRLQLEVNGTLIKDSIKQLTLKDIFVNDPVLALFQPIPSKENGIDIEGIAVNEKKDEIYIGFRGPVLRGNFTPIMVLTLMDGEFEQKNIKHEMRYVDLGGRGIRGMTRFGKGFLILGGPVGDEPTPYQLYSWNGTDMVPGKDIPDTSTHIQQLCVIPLPNNKAKAEGIEFLEQKDGKVQVIVVYDSEQNGGGKVFSCSL